MPRVSYVLGTNIWCTGLCTRVSKESDLKCQLQTAFVGQTQYGISLESVLYGWGALVGTRGIMFSLVDQDLGAFLGATRVFIASPSSA